MNRTEEFVRAILERAVEDYYGLWEVLWRARREHQEGETDAWLTAEKAVRRLIADGYVILYTGLSFDGDQVSLSDTKASAVLRERDNWKVPQPNQLQYRIGATDSGERQFYSVR